MAGGEGGGGEGGGRLVKQSSMATLAAEVQRAGVCVKRRDTAHELKG